MFQKNFSIVYPCERNLRKNSIVINQFYATGLSLYHLKTSGNLLFPNILTLPEGKEKDQLHEMS